MGGGFTIKDQQERERDKNETKKFYQKSSFNQGCIDLVKKAFKKGLTHFVLDTICNVAIFNLF